MNIGYSFWGFQADDRVKNGKYVSAPDGCATVNWCIVNELTKRGHKVYGMLPNRDAEIVYKLGEMAFSALAVADRFKAYKSITWVEDLKEWPDLDVLFLEWRFPIEGRNMHQDIGTPWYQPDWVNQTEMLGHYARLAKSVAWDLDYKYGDRQKTDGVVESGWSRGPDSHVDPPFDFSHIHDLPIMPADGSIVYVGSRYARDWSVTKYLWDAARMKSNRVIVYGNWMEGGRNSADDWADVEFGHRISFGEFRDVYKNAAVTPLLAKEEYCENGFQVYRILESVIFGCIPVQIEEFKSPIQYIPAGFDLIARDGQDLIEIANRATKDFEWRKTVINAFREHLAFMNPSKFVDDISRVAGVKL